MNEIKTRAIRDIEAKLSTVEPGSLRHHILENVRSFKTSWIALGRALYTVWKDKMYKEWGYMKFEAYAAKELGIRKQTALKLLRSYYFLEKEEPGYLQRGYTEETPPAAVPTYEAVDVLRLASKKKDLDRADYADIKKKVLEHGRDAREVKKDLTALIRQREELSPQEARQKRKQVLVRRFLSLLRSTKEELAVSKMLSASVVQELDVLIGKIEREMEQ
jgi:hypothetical protein